MMPGGNLRAGGLGREKLQRQRAGHQESMRFSGTLNKAHLREQTFAGVLDLSPSGAQIVTHRAAPR